MELWEKSREELEQNRKEMNQKLDSLYQQVGKELLSDSTVQKLPVTQKYLAEQKKLSDSISMLTFMLESQEEKKVCPSCGSMIRMSALFCDQCGMPQEGWGDKNETSEDKIQTQTVQIPEQLESEKRTCPNCGTEIREGALFCKECGNRIG